MGEAPPSQRSRYTVEGASSEYYHLTHTNLTAMAMGWGVNALAQKTPVKATEVKRLKEILMTISTEI